MAVHLFGIRHHGPGSARSLRQALVALQPDVLLVEGPPEAAPVLPLVTREGMRPPVALLLYVPDEPRRAVYYPLAVFSPEWQALQYAAAQSIPVRFMDLPQTHRLALQHTPLPSPGDAPPDSAGTTPDEMAPAPEDVEHPGASSGEPEPEPAGPPPFDPRRDPIGWLARTAGYSDGERWWDHLVEQRRDGQDLFAAIQEAMTVLREAVEEQAGAEERPEEARLQAQREAYMRQTIRAAEREGFERIAVVCGAWHTPALARMPAAREDARLLQGLPKVRVQATWVPWTHGRLSLASGYGAGIEAPGWYQHLWEYPEGTAIHWLARVARLLRGEDLDASSASVIEAVRLSEALAGLRNRPAVGLPELNDGAEAVLCFGNSLPMGLIHDKLIVGEVLGSVPDDTPMVPLQQDLQREQRRLRLQPQATRDTLDLDLRNETHLDRSRLLHRLHLLGIPWGEAEEVTGTGTFKERWVVQWRPELSVSVIEASVWGTTIEDAASARAADAAANATDLAALTTLLDQTVLADLPAAAERVMAALGERAALAADVPQLMAALPPLARVTRYGSVRQTDRALVEGLVDGLVVRICIGLPAAASSLDDEAAAALLARIMDVQHALRLLGRAEQLEAWHTALARLADQSGLHGLVAGRCCRLLLDAEVFTREGAARRLSLALSTAVDPAQAAAWVVGMLAGSGLLLLHDEGLWSVLDGWVSTLRPDSFTQLLPLLRRTFSTFPAPERRQMGERVRRGATYSPSVASAAGVDVERANRVLPLIARLLGLGA